MRYCSASLPFSVEPLEISKLTLRSNSVTRPILFHYVSERAALVRMAAAPFDAVAQGILTFEPGKVYPLTEGAVAHTELEHRQASAPLLLQPSYILAQLLRPMLSIPKCESRLGCSNGA